MKIRTFRFVVLFSFLFMGICTLAQNTYLYKRVMIVKDGILSNKNDDAHYIAFTDKGCYESDKKGFTTNQGFLEFVKNENNLHCYYGSCSFGKAHYYFSADYNRLNVKLNDNLVYVYQIERSGKTNAKFRPMFSNNGGSGGLVSPPLVNGGTSSGTSSGGASHIKCTDCNGTGRCRHCNGRGTSILTGHTETCVICGGSGSCKICFGRGRLR